MRSDLPGSPLAGRAARRRPGASPGAGLVLAGRPRGDRGHLDPGPGGDGGAEAEWRDRVYTLKAPFDGEPAELITTANRFGGRDTQNRSKSFSAAHQSVSHGFNNSSTMNGRSQKIV